jgi:hypothetical protein
MIYRVGQIDQWFSSLQSFVKNVDTNFYMEGRQLAVTTKRNVTLEDAPHDGLTSFGIGTFNDWAANEMAHSHISPLFEGTVIHEIMNHCKSLIPFKIGRVRLLRLTARSCYSFHQDLDLRIQIPIFTSEESLFFIGKADIFHLPSDGSVFLLNAREPHTAINGHSDLDRIHLVMSLIAEKEEDYNFFLCNNILTRAPYPKKLAKVYEPTMNRLFNESHSNE